MNRINGVEPHIALALYSGIEESSLVDKFNELLQKSF